MARLSRIVIPGLPHHVTQRGNGRAQVFFDDADYALYRDWLGEACRVADVALWAWVLMPNHVHLILVPSDPDGIRRAMAPLHRRYAGHIHARMKRTGHFWQGRFGCVAMDEDHLAAALRYVALNPVRARLVERARDWNWSSAHAQLGLDDGITDTSAIHERFPDFAALLTSGEDEAMSQRLRRAETIGRPIGNTAFLEHLERDSGRALAPAKRGPKPRQN
jgi:putative transposase